MRIYNHCCPGVYKLRRRRISPWGIKRDTAADADAGPFSDFNSRWDAGSDYGYLER